MNEKTGSPKVGQEVESDPWPIDGPSGMRILIARVRRIPDGARNYSLSCEMAWHIYRIPKPLANLLVENGMPHRVTAGGLRFDSSDLFNVAIYFDTGAPHRKLFAWWVRELTRPRGPVVDYRLAYRAPLTIRDELLSDVLEFLGPAGRAAKDISQAFDGAPMAQFDFSLRSEWPDLPCSAREVIDEIRDIEYLRLPRALRDDVKFVEESRVGDCKGTSELLVSLALRRGLLARPCFGRALTPPFTALHFWAEIEVDEIWVPVDPLIIKVLHNLGLPMDAWSIYSSIGGILARLGAKWEPSAVQGGVAVPVSAYSSRIEISSKTSCRVV